MRELSTKGGEIFPGEGEILPDLPEVRTIFPRGREIFPRIGGIFPEFSEKPEDRSGRREISLGKRGFIPERGKEGKGFPEEGKWIPT